ncbi:type II toxin-antitoxin system Phd/YefM family antitoxin [Levilactobacillus cerevisiae]|uniref:type II toxin-antitoxin system Phd/YefM family antitoxin n=1 Tax=Levilactobacillus cerevisiae TaxID=1704076 RepID=UPI000F7713F3|nr:type II toxin-antitoxin system Phd/YefM family antitoxin [Levilactobacillus cerevisiae]
MRTMKVPVSSLAELKQSPVKLFEEAERERTGVYIFNHDQPVGVVLGVADYEALVNENAALQDQLFELEQDELVAQRLDKQEREHQPLVPDQVVRGTSIDNTMPLTDNDGWL